MNFLLPKTFEKKEGLHFQIFENHFLNDLENGGESYPEHNNHNLSPLDYEKSLEKRASMQDI